MPTGKRRALICGVNYDAQLKSGVMSQLDLAPVAAKLGAQGVEYREVYWKDNKEKELSAIREQLDRLGMERMYATYTFLFNRDVEKQKQLMRDLEDAHALGVPLMRVFRGERPGDGPEDAYILDAAREVIERARSWGMKLALENRADPLTPYRMEEIKETIDRMDSASLEVNIDTYNYAVSNQSPVDAVKLLGQHIIYVHMKDVLAIPGGFKPTYLGNGTLAIADIVAALDGTGRDFAYCFEFDGEGDAENAITRSIEYLGQL